MSKLISLGYTDTAISGVSELPYLRGLLNFKANWKVKSSTPTEIILTNISSPMDRPEEMRIGFSPVTNIYQKASIDPSVAAPTKRGVSLLVQITNIMSVTDSTDADFRIDLPLEAHMVIKVPCNENLTSTHIIALIGRLLSGLFETGSTDTTRLEAMLRGSLVPSDL